MAMKKIHCLFFVLVISTGIILVTCCSTKNNTGSKTIKKPDKDPAPGTVLVSADLVSFEEQEIQYDCSLKLHTILEYGPATPVLAQGSIIRATCKKTLLENNGFNMNDLQKLSPLKMLLSSEKGMGEKFVLWRIKAIYAKSEQEK